MVYNKKIIFEFVVYFYKEEEVYIFLYGVDNFNLKRTCRKCISVIFHYIYIKCTEEPAASEPLLLYLLCVYYTIGFCVNAVKVQTF